MGITKLTKDVAQVSKLGDYPRTDNGLSTDELKAWFDKAPIIIKEYLNGALVPELDKKFGEIDRWIDTYVAAPKDYVDKQVRNASPYNLLDNSDFRNPVNQRGNDSYTLGRWGGYAIDRWTAYIGGCTVTVSGDGIQLNGELYQPISKETARRYNGKTVTIAAKMGGNVYCTHGVVNQKGAYNVTARVDTPDGTLLLTCENTDILFFILDTATSTVVEWAALYEGEYTAETLPEYQPKGYAVELAECQRYYYRTPKNIQMDGHLTGNAKQAYGYLYVPQMRIKPSIANNLPSMTVRTVSGYSDIANDTSPYGSPTAQTLETNPENAPGMHAVKFTFASTVGPNNTPISINLRNSAYLEFSADL